MSSYSNFRGAGLSAKALAKKVEDDDKARIQESIGAQTSAQRQNIAQRKRKSSEDTEVEERSEIDRLLDKKFKRLNQEAKSEGPSRIFERKSEDDEAEMNVNLQELRRLTEKMKKGNSQVIRQKYALKVRTKETEEFLLEQARKREIAKRKKAMKKKAKMNQEGGEGEGATSSSTDNPLKAAKENNLMKELKKESVKFE